MNDLYLFRKLSMVFFAISLIFLILFFVSISRAQQPGIHFGWIKGTGHVYGLQVNEFKDKYGFYINYYSYTYQPYQQPGCDYRNVANSYSSCDEISDTFYKGLTLGISRRVTRDGSRHPAFAYVGAGNIDITKRHRVYTNYNFSGFEKQEVTWYDRTWKCLSPEVGGSVAAFDGKWLQVGVGSFFKYQVGVSGWFYISAKF